METVINGYKWLKMVINGYKWLKMFKNGLKKHFKQIKKDKKMIQN